MSLIQNLSYVVVGSTDTAKWRSYGTEVLGMQEVKNSEAESVVYLKMDSQRPFRYMIVEAEFDGLLFAGWNAGSEDSFNAVKSQLDSAGTVYAELDEADLKSRSINAGIRLADPAGNNLEVFWAEDSAEDQFESPLDISSFIVNAKDGTDMGLGHVVLHAPVDFEATHDFYTSLGFGDSDVTDMSDKGMGKIYFMHCNPRHHSLALWSWGAPSPETDFAPSPESKAPGCVHLMAEVPKLSEVGACLDRVNEREIPVLSTLGEHINDEMVSFYMLSPGNFAIEFGTGGLEVSDDWETTSNTEASVWGHKWAG